MYWCIWKWGANSFNSDWRSFRLCRWKTWSSLWTWKSNEKSFRKKYVSGLTQIGIRNVSSTAKEGYVDAREKGSKIFSVRHLRKLGTNKILEQIPKNKRYYITIDIDAFDPSIASGTGTPSHGGFYYYEILELLDGIIKQGSVVGLDLVEVAPDYDLTNSTSTLAAQLLMNAIGRILHNKKKWKVMQK